jgi:flavodoxin
MKARRRQMMKGLVVYDSNDKNAERLAVVIGEQLQRGGEVEVVPVNSLSTRDIAEVDLLAVGGPTWIYGLSAPLKGFLHMMPNHRVYGVNAVTFGTRMPGLQFLTGSAARQAANILTHKGAVLLMPPESFFTRGIRGPLAEGEIERARAWAKAVLAQLQAHAASGDGHVPAESATAETSQVTPGQ